MDFVIRLGKPHMFSLWLSFRDKADSFSLKPDEKRLYSLWGSGMAKLAKDPFYPGLHSHEIRPLSQRAGIRVFESYLENNNPRAYRMFWVYGPGKGEITVVGLEPHPEVRKNGAYQRVTLSFDSFFALKK
jgi:hypothetical protein